MQLEVCYYYISLFYEVTVELAETFSLFVWMISITTWSQIYEIYRYIQSVTERPEK